MSGSEASEPGSEASRGPGSSPDSATPTEKTDPAVDREIERDIGEPNLEVLEAPEDREAVVIRWLREHPDVLSRYPEVVEILEVPHDTGSAVSLVAYQVAILRKRNAALHGRMQELVANARENEDVTQNLHRLALTVMDCTSADEILGGLYQGLREDFGADFAALRLFGPPLHAADANLAEFQELTEHGRASLEPVLAAGIPQCGPANQAQLQPLLGEQSVDVGSCALVPLGSPHAIGVLVVGSRDPNRYHRAMGTLFLRRLGEILTAVLRSQMHPSARVVGAGPG